MAYSKPSTDLSASILAGSEESYDYFCQPCSSEQHLEAVGYCQECCQYLCVACIKYHRRLASTEYHTVLDKSDMPKTSLPKRVQQTDILTAKCLKHPDKELEYFCTTHNQICCNVCVTLDHSSCSGKSYIPDISGGVAKSKEFSKLKAEIYRLIGEITKRQETINRDKNIHGKYHDKVLTDIKDVRKQINELLDKLEEDTKRNVTKFHQENIGNIETSSEAYQSLLSEINSMATNMDTSEKAGNNNQLFVQVKLFCNRIAEVDRQVNENEEYKIKRYTFNKDEITQQMKSTLSSIWSLSVGQDVTHTNARYVREIKVKADTVKDDCVINGVTVLSNDRMIVTDAKNKNAKLIDTKLNKVISRLAVSSRPNDITVMKSNQVAVALGQDMKIGIISVANTLCLSQTIRTPGVVIFGLCFNGLNFIVTCQQPGCIKIIDMSGTSLSTISTGNNGEQLFSCPCGIALSRDKDVIYTTDMVANTMAHIALSGQVMSVYRHDKLKFPAGVVVCMDGAVYVCSRATNTVHQLTYTGDLSQIILERGTGLASWPSAIAYRDDMLYISSSGATSELSNYIRIYQLEKISVTQMC